MTSRTSERGNEIRYRSTPDLRRVDFAVESDHEVEIFVRSISGADPEPSLPAVLLLHGARASSVPSFDLDVAGGSLAADLAYAGHPVYLMDARGFGGSTRPEAMDRPADENPPLTRSTDAIRDISVVVDQIRRERGHTGVAMMGWATGSQWMTHYAATSPDYVSHLVLYNAVWPVSGKWPIGDDLEDPDRPGEIRPGALGAYGFASAEALLARWNGSIPIDDLDEWRDPAMVEAYLAAAVGADPTASERDPASFRTPLGPLADTFDLSRGKSPFDPGTITARVLVLRSELDFWSREIDVEAPLADLTAAESVERVEIPRGTHYAHLDRPERGRNFLVESVTRFLGEDRP